MNKTIKEIENKGKVNDAGMMEYNYLIVTTENEWLYIRENLNPVPQVGDNISYDISSSKRSGKGNEYFNIKNLYIVPKDGQPQEPQDTRYAHQPSEPSVQKAVTNELKKTGNYLNPNLVMFATGITGRSMQSGRFTKNDISDLTRLSVEAFKEWIE